MTRHRRRDFPQVLLLLAAPFLALSLALVGCGGGAQSPPPAATSPAPQTATATASVSPTPARPPTQAPVQVAPEEAEDRTLIVYSGRSRTLVHPLLEAFGEHTGVDIRVKYGAALQRRSP